MLRVSCIDPSSCWKSNTTNLLIAIIVLPGIRYKYRFNLLLYFLLSFLTSKIDQQWRNCICLEDPPLVLFFWVIEISCFSEAFVLCFYVEGIFDRQSMLRLQF